MIEVNLSPVQVTQDFTKVGPINLSLINPVYFGIAIVAIYLTEGLVDGYFDEDIKKLEIEYKTEQNKLTNLKRQLAEFDTVVNQVKELKKKEKELEQKIDIIKQIVDKRQNPFFVLKYIAEKTPEEIWISELEIDDVNVRITGYSKTFYGITKFQEELRSSEFFNQNVDYTKPQALLNEYRGNPVLPFELTTVVTNWYGE